MEDNVYVWIEKKCYRLYYLGVARWRLFYLSDRRKLNINLAHGLDFWRQKGVIEGEEEKGS